MWPAYRLVRYFRKYWSFTDKASKNRAMSVPVMIWSINLYKKRQAFFVLHVMFGRKTGKLNNNCDVRWEDIDWSQNHSINET